MLTKRFKLFDSRLKRSLAVGIALSCLGAAVCASPMRTTMRANLEPQRAEMVQRVSLAPLATGPAIRLSRASDSDGDCVQAATVVASPVQSPYGALTLPRRLSCGD
jgi:hypothetical protein